MGFFNEINPDRCDEYYRKYIKNHINNVQRAFQEYGEELCKAIGADYDQVAAEIANHDESKYSPDEFKAYRLNFYPALGEYNDEKLFNKAWLHHIHNNKHHPEHWIIPTNEGNTILDMPVEYIVEMLCDWQSFKYTGKGTAYAFYYNIDRKEGLLSYGTRRLVEVGLEILKGDK